MQPDTIDTRPHRDSAEAFKATAAPAPLSRLDKFQEWLALEMARRLIWPKDLNRAVQWTETASRWAASWTADIQRTPWLWEPSALAKHAASHLDKLRRYQDVAGVEVGDGMDRFTFETHLGHISRAWRATRAAGVHGYVVTPASALAGAFKIIEGGRA
jgi:hypothetical protein